MKRTGSGGEIVAIDVVEPNVSKALREAIALATRSPKTSHLFLDVHAVPILQGIGTKNDLMRHECGVLIKTIYDNSAIVICPREGEVD